MTGAGGFIGGHPARALLTEGNSVRTPSSIRKAGRLDGRAQFG